MPLTEGVCVATGRLRSQLTALLAKTVLSQEALSSGQKQLDRVTPRASLYRTLRAVGQCGRALRRSWRPRQTPIADAAPPRFSATFIENTSLVRWLACLSILVLLRSGMGSVPNATKAHSSCWYVSFVAGGKQLLPLDHPEAAAFSQSTIRKVTGRAVGKRERLKFDKEWSSLTSTVPGYFIWNDK